MKQGYIMIKEYYKKHTGYGKIGNILALGLNQYTEFLKEDIHILDN
jgi:hypothetical protein